MQSLEQKIVSISQNLVNKESSNIWQTCPTFYSPDSPWNEKITKPVYEAESSKYTSNIKGDFGADTSQYTFAVYEVDSLTSLTKVYYSGVLSFVTDNNVLQKTKDSVISVPIPANAKASPGKDAQLIILNKETGEEWGLFHGVKNSDGSWNVENLYRYNIKLSAVAPIGFASRGAGIPYLAGLIRKCEIDRGYIDHAIAFAYNYPSPKFVYPATKSDGKGDTNKYLPEGARLQLDPNVSGETITSWCSKDSRINARSCRILVKALQDYGMILVDGSDHPKIYAESSLTSDWEDLWSKYIPSNIPFSYFKVIKY